MKSLLKTILKYTLPYGIWRLLQSLRHNNSNTFSGDYSSWEKAEIETTGYDQAAILSKVHSATDAVKNGKAVYERDSVLFYEPEYNWPLLTVLNSIAAKNQGKLSVLDFGGALGSVYWQNKSQLFEVSVLSWNIVEQRAFVDCGQKYFTTEELHFYPDIASCMKNTQIDVILFSSVLQYLKTPYDIIKEAVSYNTPYIILDRLPILSGEKDRLAIQKVSPNIYEATYPAWFFSKPNILNAFYGYHTISEFQALGKEEKIFAPKAISPIIGIVLKKDK